MNLDLLKRLPVQATADPELKVIHVTDQRVNVCTANCNSRDQQHPYNDSHDPLGSPVCVCVRPGEVALQKRRGAFILVLNKLHLTCQVKL